MGKTYVISDTHFFHQGIIGIAGRPFGSVDEMNMALLDNINRVVKAEDTLFHLGDFGKGSVGLIQSVVSRIKCPNMFLIMGNHDRHWSSQCWREVGFQEVSRWPVIYDDWCILCHEPVYVEVNSPFGVVYGHTHQNKYDNPNGHYFNACVEVNGYSPVLLDDIKENIQSETGQKFAI
jgi:calcineurin-like phosphoesterase family protein